MSDNVVFCCKKNPVVYEYGKNTIQSCLLVAKQATLNGFGWMSSKFVNKKINTHIHWIIQCVLKRRMIQLQYDSSLTV